MPWYCDIHDITTKQYQKFSQTNLVQITLATLAILKSRTLDQTSSRGPPISDEIMLEVLLALILHDS